MSKFTDFFKGAFNKVTKAIAAPFNMVKDTVKTVVEAPLKIFNKGADTLSGMSKNMTGMVGGISKDIGGVANGLTGAVGGIAKGGFDMIGGVLKSPVMLIGGAAVAIGLIMFLNNKDKK